MWKHILETFARKPISVFLLTISLILLGIVAWQDIPIDLFPNISFPYAAVVTPYLGAGPEEVEVNVTNPIEEAVGLVSGVKRISSRSFDSFSVVEVEFEWGTDISYAVSKIRELIDAFARDLPEDVDPIVVEFNPAMIPVYVVGIGTKEPNNIETLSKDLQQNLSRLDGVANVEILGIPDKEVLIDVDPEKLEKMEIPFDSVKIMLSAGTKYPMGKITEEDNVYPLSVSTKFASLKELEETIIGFRGMSRYINFQSLSSISDGLKLPPFFVPVRLKQVADVGIKQKEVRGGVRVNAESAAVLVVQKRGGMNTIKVAKKVRERLSLWKEEHPGVVIQTITDTSEFTNMAINGLFKNLLLGAIVATIVIYLFLRSVSATLAVTVSIPLSLLTAIMLMYFSKLNFDLMTLGGLTVAVGMVVDNSIVILEAIYRYLEEKMNPVEAASKGGREVVGAIFASTMTTLAMFVPFAFITGFAAQLFKFFAISLSFTLIASFFIAITVVPAFANIVKAKPSRDHRILKGYKRVLDKLLTHKKGVIIAFVIIFVISVFGLLSKGLEFIPEVDSGVLNVSFALPSNTPYTVVSKALEEIESYLMENKDELHIVSTYSVFGQPGTILSALRGIQENEADMQINLTPSNKRDKSSSEIAESLRSHIEKVMKKYNGSYKISSGAIEVESIFGTQIRVTFYDNDLEKLRQLAEEFARKLEKISGVIDVTTSFRKQQQVYELSIDRGKALTAGVFFMQALGAVQPYTVGINTGNIFIDGENIPIILHLKDSLNPDTIRKIKIPSFSAKDAYMGMIADLKKKVVPSTIFHRDGQRIAFVNASVFNRPLGDVVKDIENMVDSEYKAENRPEIGGQAANLQETVTQFLKAMIMGIILMYLIIGAQFESLVYPLVIFFTLPMALVGVALVVYLTGITVNVSTLMGMLTLAGITVNNGIVMITYINQLRERGMEKREAIIEGAARRSRPILMTTLTTIIALIPTAVSNAAGSELDRPMALTVVGGLLMGMVFTLFLIPLLYDIIDKISLRFTKKKTFSEKGIRC
ncbi:efflux RND transporter permease subunit [Kosmotoga olearia]|uniref:Acriflavin resistance protein n=1 Tax=Kosmotoga olearia (strain ATCC BAA-1733 / DSM 21960 / TBF 19.5.1) TaxID=521045 RepID=C5CDW4_KOSOT|nr:efflux RND transporter permease subunit [Kosmotoga olearia]ACR79133.1 acriflavin resistance protein [Kosmotoga olearia TBF 19.5.1]